MLQKSKSKKAGMMKYLVVIPMVVLSMIIFSTTAMAQEKQVAKEEKSESLEKKKETLLKEIKEFNATVPKEEKIKVIDKEFIEEIIQDLGEITEIKEVKYTDDPIPFAILENTPIFQGCENKTATDAKSCFMNAMNEHIKANFTYPKEAQDKNVQGRVTIMFTINKQGVVDDFRVKGTGKENSYLIENEALRIMKLLPKFKPGMSEGKPVSVSYAQPIMFKLQPEEKPKLIEVKE